MQAAPAHRAATIRTATLLPSTITPSPFPAFGTALRAVESLLLSGGQATARRNAWASVLEDRRRAKDRREVEHVLEAVATRSSSAP